MKKQILFVNGHLNVGGVENSLINVIKVIDFEEYDVDLILLEDMGDYVKEVPKEVNVIHYDLSNAYGPFLQSILQNFKKRNWVSLFLRIIFFLEKFIGVKALILARPLFNLSKSYDCAIAYRVGFCTEFVSYVVDSKKKVTWWHHGAFDYPRKLAERWNSTFKSYDRLVAVSENSKKLLLNNMCGINNKILIIPNIINTKEIREKSNSEINVNFDFREKFTLVSVGRLEPEKGMVNCVYACKKLIENGYETKWYLIGEGTQRSEIESRIKEFKLEKNIILLGAATNPYPYIKKASLYIHPSLVESFALTVLEAMALNTPVVVAKSMGPMEFIKDKENGLLVDPTPDGLFEGIITLIKDDKLYAKLKRDKTEELKSYSPEVVIEKIYELIEG